MPKGVCIVCASLGDRATDVDLDGRIEPIYTNFMCHLFTPADIQLLGLLSGHAQHRLGRNCNQRTLYLPYLDVTDFWHF